MRLWPESKTTRLEREVAELRAGFANPGDWLYEALGGSTTYSGQRVTADKAMGMAAVYGAVSLISETVGMLPLKVYRKTDGERVEADTHRSWRMLHDKPNSATTAHNFWATVTAHLKLHGNAYLEKDRDPFTGEITSLYIQDPGAITVEWNGRRKRFVDYGPPKREWTEEEMLHIYELSLNGVTGVSPIAMCRNPLGTAMSREEFEGGFYKRGAKFAGHIEHPGSLREQGIKNIAEQFAAIHHGGANMHKTPVLDEGATYKTDQMVMEDMQFVESKQMSRSDVAIIFKIPPSYLAASSGDSLTYATVEGNKIQLAQTAIMPTTNTIAKAISNDPEILPQPSMYAEFVLEGLLRADKKTEAEYLEKLEAMGVIDAKFIAELLNLPKPPPPKPVPAPLQPFQNGDGAVRPDDVPSALNGN
jgi:HK97 family phage portal protein